MPIVIAAINGKGGAGKTTALMNIAGEYALRGGTVAMLDIDPRNNLMKWWSDCHDKDNQAEGIDVFGPKAGKAIVAFFERQADGFDYVLVDTPGEDTSIIDPVVAHADLVISPVQPSKREVVGAIECFEIRCSGSTNAWARVPAWRAEDTHHHARPSHRTLPQDPPDHRRPGGDLSVSDRGP